MGWNHGLGIRVLGNYGLEATGWNRRLGTMDWESRA
jgi:hypothetical protein